MPDFGGAWAWRKAIDSTDDGVGSLIGAEEGWSGSHPLSKSLVAAFARWQRHFERHAFDEVLAHQRGRFQWREFHQEGKGLCQRLKQEVGDAARVIYDKPTEDVNYRDGEHTEFYIDGSYEVVESIAAPRAPTVARRWGEST